MRNDKTLAEKMERLEKFFMSLSRFTLNYNRSIARPSVSEEY